MTESNSAGNETDFSFTVSGGVVAVVYIQAKPDINAFTYAGGTVGDSGLHAPLSDGNLESVEFTVWCVASVTGGLTAATLRSVTARASARILTVRWRTASELGVAGYRVYGYVHGRRVALSTRLIASKSSGPTPTRSATACRPARRCPRALRYRC